MGVKAEEIRRVCQGGPSDYPPLPWDTHYQFSIKTLLLKRKSERKSKKSKETEGERARCVKNRGRKGAGMIDTERTRGVGAGGGERKRTEGKFVVSTRRRFLFTK